MDYETLYFELLEDVQNFEKSVQKQMEELISVSWSRTWQLSLRQELNFVKSASEMRRKLSEVSVYAAEVYVAVSSSVSSLRCL